MAMQIYFGAVSNNLLIDYLLYSRFHRFLAGATKRCHMLKFCKENFRK